MNTASMDVNLLKNYYFNIDTSKSGTANVSFTMDGNFRDDLGSAGPFVDGNMLLITSSIVSDMNVEFDTNGLYTISTNSLGAGTYYIDLNYNTVDYNYLEQIVIQVNNPPTVTPPSGSPGGSSGTPPAERDTNQPEDTNTPEPPEGPQGPAGNEGGEETGGNEGGETGPGNETTGDTTPPALNPATGLFGLGDVTPIATGLIALILIILGIVIVKKKMK